MKLFVVFLFVAAAMAMFNPRRLVVRDGNDLVVRQFGSPTVQRFTNDTVKALHPIAKRYTNETVKAPLAKRSNETLVKRTNETALLKNPYSKRAMVDATQYADITGQR